MKAMVADAMAHGAIGLGASYSLNHSGYGGVPMPSTIAPMSELDALVGAMGPRGKGVVEIASGVKTPQELEPMAAKYGRPFFQGTGVAMYNEQEPARVDQDVRGLRRRASAAASGSTSRSPASRCRSTSRWPTPIRSTAIRRSTRSRPIRRSS